MKLRVFTAFSGYDSQCMALDRLGIDYDLVGWSEIDKHAIKAHNAVYPQYADRNFGDIKKIDWQSVPDFDLFTYSSPCQDFSQAGLQRGGEKGSGTRSSLLWECERAIETKRPKYLLMENVAALVSEKFRPLFNRWQLVLERLGYANNPMVMNAKDYGVPQNRERVFLLSVYNPDNEWLFLEAPKPFKLQRRLKDVLESNVDECYYLSDERLKGLQIQRQEPLHTDKEGNALCISGRYSKESARKLIGNDGAFANTIVLGWTRTANGETYRHPVEVGNTVTSHKRDNTQNYILEPVSAALRTRAYAGIEQRLEVGGEQANSITSVEKDSLVVEPINTDADGNAVTLNSGYYKYGYQTLCGHSYETSGTAVMESGVAVHPLSHKFEFKGFDETKAPALRATDYKAPHCYSDGFRVRKLTPRECFRLMDVDEANIDKIIGSGIAKTNLYKLAGNSIVVACLYHIFRQLLITNLKQYNL